MTRALFMIWTTTSGGGIDSCSILRGFRMFNFFSFKFSVILVFIYICAYVIVLSYFSFLSLASDTNTCRDSSFNGYQRANLLPILLLLLLFGFPPMPTFFLKIGLIVFLSQSGLGFFAAAVLWSYITMWLYFGFFLLKSSSAPAISNTKLLQQFNSIIFFNILLFLLFFILFFLFDFFYFLLFLLSCI